MRIIELEFLKPILLNFILFDKRALIIKVIHEKDLLTELWIHSTGTQSDK